MNAERIIAEIEWLEQLFRLPDKRSLLIADWGSGNRKIAAIKKLDQLFILDQRPHQVSDGETTNQKYDETYTDDPRFRLWRPDDDE